MSIASEIERLQNAKADLKTAIMAKGVEVADTDTIDTYASKVEAIEVGSGDSWYDTFWDDVQNYGERTDYGTASKTTNVLSGSVWNDNNFKPKYDIRPTEGYAMFERVNITSLRDLDVVLDFSGCRDCRELFASANVEYLGILDLSKNINRTYNMTFNNCKKLKSITKLILSAVYPIQKNRYYNMFNNCSALTDVIVEGNINENISLVSSPLTAESAKSFINCLENYAGAENEFAFTITFSPTTWDYLDAEGNASPNGNSWREYINDLGWNAS